MFEAHIKISWKTLGIAAGAVAALAVIVLTVQEAGTLIAAMKSHSKGLQVANVGETNSVNHANFAYLVPAPDAAWTFDAKSVATDEDKGVVKYSVKLKYAGANLTLSQQAFPSDLAPRGSEKFEGFINSQKAALSQKVGAGTVYYMSALQNGSPAKGADTMIFATDDVLLFGRSSAILGYDAWAKLLASMRTSGKQ